MIKIQDILRAGHVKRWNIINTTRQQTLAEHLFNVAMITESMLTELRLDEYRNIALTWALMHDVPEVVCGDTPTPTKKRMVDKGFSMEDIYEDIDPTYKEVKLTVKDVGGGIAYDLVKIADVAESIHFLSENGVGDHAKGIVLKMKSTLDSTINDFVRDHHEQVEEYFVEETNVFINPMLKASTPTCGPNRFIEDLIRDKVIHVVNNVLNGKIYE